MTESLITRLEQATEGTRELDLEFHKALGKCPEDAELYTRSRDGLSYVSWQRAVPGGGGGGVCAERLPNYFTSGGIPAELLEAVPEGWGGQGLICWPGMIEGRIIAPYLAELHHAISSGGGPKGQGFGATPALALGAAILKALNAVS